MANTTTCNLAVKSANAYAIFVNTEHSQEAKFSDRCSIFPDMCSEAVAKASEAFWVRRAKFLHHCHHCISISEKLTPEEPDSSCRKVSGLL